MSFKIYHPERFEKGFKIADPSKNGADMSVLTEYDKNDNHNILFDFDALYDKYGSEISNLTKTISNDKIVSNNFKSMTEFNDEDDNIESIYDEFKMNKNNGKKAKYNIHVFIGNFYENELHKNMILPETDMIHSFSDMIHGITEALQYDFFVEMNKRGIYDSLHVLYFGAIFKNIYSKLQYNLINHFEEKVIRDGIESCLTRLIIDRDAQRWFTTTTESLIRKYIASRRFDVLVSNFNVNPDRIDYSISENNTKIYRNYNIKENSKYKFTGVKFIIPDSNDTTAEIKLSIKTVITAVQHLLFHTMLSIIIRKLIVELSNYPNNVEKGIISDIIRHYSFAASSISEIYSSQEKLYNNSWEKIRKFILTEIDDVGINKNLKPRSLSMPEPDKEFENRINTAFIELFTFINNANSIDGIDGIEGTKCSEYFEQMYSVFKVLMLRIKDFIFKVQDQLNSFEDDDERSRAFAWVKKVIEYKFESLFNNGIPISTYKRIYYLEFDYETVMKTGKFVVYNDKDEPINNSDKFDPPILWRNSDRYDLKFIFSFADVIIQIIKLSENCIDWMNMLKDKIETMYAKDLDIANNIIGMKYFIEGKGTFSPTFITPNSVLFEKFRSYSQKALFDDVYEIDDIKKDEEDTVSIRKRPVIKLVDGILK